MRNFWLLCCLGSLVLAIFVSSSENPNSKDGAFISFLKSFKEIKLTFPTGIAGDTITLKIKSRPGTVRPSLQTALAFLKDNYSYMEVYKTDIYDCKQFALRLFEDIQRANFEAKYVIISLINQSEGHALAAIETSDAGTLFVDFTPYVLTNKEQKPSRSIAQVREGAPYLRMPLESLPSDFKNTQQDFGFFEAQIRQAEREISDYNQKVSKLEQEKKALEERIQSFNQKVSRGVASGEESSLRLEQENIKQTVADINGQFDLLNLKESSLRNNYSTLDWIGKNWIVKTVRIVP